MFKVCIALLLTTSAYVFSVPGYPMQSVFSFPGSNVVSSNALNNTNTPQNTPISNHEHVHSVIIPNLLLFRGLKKLFDKF